MEEKTKFADEHYHLLFQLAFSARYHQRREAFYEFLDRTAKAIAVIFGAATVSTFLDKAHPDLKSWVSASISISSTLSLVFGLSQKARLHLDLRRRYGQLESRLIALEEEDLPSLKKIRSEISLIEADEPPILATLVQICQNEISRAWNRSEMIFPVPIWKRFFANFVNLEASIRRNPSATNSEK